MKRMIDVRLSFNFLFINNLYRPIMSKNYLFLFTKHIQNIGQDQEPSTLLYSIVTLQHKQKF
jgi:hypothetical protein